MRRYGRKIDKRVNGEILKNDPCMLCTMFRLCSSSRRCVALCTFLGLALLEKVREEDLAADIFGKLFKEGAFDRERERIFLLYFYLFNESHWN